ncbi:MAG: transcriptional regulator [Gammaproteobacteria bacterium]|nr:transcriptional regulator [Gammaproteobacteria bacterium]
MGTKKPCIFKVLFSKTKRQVLALLYGNPDRSYYANEIVRSAGTGIGAVQRELEKSATAGLVTVRRIGNQKHYQANRESPIFEELRGIVTKTFGIADVLSDVLTPFLERIHAAFIYGAAAKEMNVADSDIDVMIISDELSHPDIFPALEKAENFVKRKINPALYNNNEFRRKLKKDNVFLTRILGQPKIFIIGSEDDLPKPR